MDGRVSVNREPREIHERIPPDSFSRVGAVRGRNARPGSVSATAIAATAAISAAAVATAIKPAMSTMISTVKAAAIMMVVGMVRFRRTARIAITAATPKPEIVRRAVVVGRMG